MALTSAVKVYLPLGVAGAATSVTSTSTAATALPAGSRFWMVATEPMSVIFGVAGVDAAVLATCMPLQADTDYVFDVPSQGVTHFRAIAVSTTGTLFISAVG